MKLQLKNPLIFIDIETTGISVAHDRIVELTLLKVYPDGREEMKVYRVNPGIPIPPAATAIHGITDEDVKDKPPFKEIARTLANEFEGCDFAGFNSNKFDIPLLAEEFLRAGVDFDFKKRKFIDVQVIFHKMEQRTLSAAYRFYCNKELVNAHSSEADTRATYEILMAQLDRYANVPYKDVSGKESFPVTNNVDALSAFSSHTRNVDYAGFVVYDEQGCEVINFGKYKGQRVEDVLLRDPSYYAWVQNGDFPLYTKKIFTRIKLRMFNKK